MEHRNDAVCFLSYIVLFLDQVVHLFNSVSRIIFTSQLTCLGTASHNTPKMPHLCGVRKQAAMGGVDGGPVE